MPDVTPEILLRAYRAGIFPMAESAEAEELHWFDPPERTIFPLDDFHVPRRLQRTIRRNPYRITCNRDFSGVITACAQPEPARKNRTASWINAEIVTLYTALHRRGHAHSLEAWQDGRLAGGLYGVSIGGAFFGESMFSAAKDASKICLVYLVAILRRQGFCLLDCQFKNPHLDQFGAVTISRADYQARLRAACDFQCDFSGFSSGGGAADSSGGSASGDPALAFLQAITHTS